MVLLRICKISLTKHSASQPFSNDFTYPSGFLQTHHSALL